MRGSWYYRTKTGHYPSLIAAWLSGEVTEVANLEHPVIYFDDPLDAVTDLGRWDNRFRVSKCRSDSYVETENFVRDWDLSLVKEEEVDTDCDYAEVLSFLKIAWPMIDGPYEACTLWIKNENVYLFPLSDGQTYLAVEVLPKKET